MASTSSKTPIIITMTMAILGYIEFQDSLKFKLKVS